MTQEVHLVAQICSWRSCAQFRTQDDFLFTTKPQANEQTVQVSMHQPNGTVYADDGCNELASLYAASLICWWLGFVVWR